MLWFSFFSYFFVCLLFDLLFELFVVSFYFVVVPFRETLFVILLGIVLSFCLFFFRPEVSQTKIINDERTNMPKKNQNSTTSSTVLDRAQVLKGVDGLLRHHQSVQKAQSKSQLFNDATAIQLVVTLRQIPPPRVRPIRM